MSQVKEEEIDGNGINLIRTNLQESRFNSISCRLLRVTSTPVPSLLRAAVLSPWTQSKNIIGSIIPRGWLLERHKHRRRGAVTSQSLSSPGNRHQQQHLTTDPWDTNWSNERGLTHSQSQPRRVDGLTD